MGYDACTMRGGPGWPIRTALPSVNLLSHPLYLIPLKEARLRIFAPGKDFGNPKRRVQARFRYGGVEYELWVTDPVVERHYLAGQDGDFSLGECFATVSLGEPHEGYCYKLIAALITKEKKAG